jgi:hypothetical protein
MTGSAPDVRAGAVDRARELLDELARYDMVALSGLALSLTDAEARSPARATAVEATRRAGVVDVLEGARLAAREYVTRIFDQAGFRVIGVDIAETRSRASVDDRVAVAIAAEDATLEAVARPFLADDVRLALTEPLARLTAASSPSWAIPPREAGRHVAVTRWSTFAVIGILVLGSLLLIVLGSGIGLFGLATAIGILLVVLVVRDRAVP